MKFSNRSNIFYNRLGGAARSRAERGRKGIMLFIAATACYTAFLYNSGGAKHFLGVSDPMVSIPKETGRKTLSVTTWNIAAINNNPFEYWITYDEDPEYARIMESIENFLEYPGAKDIAVKEIFTPTMFSELEGHMMSAGWPSVRDYWEDDYSNRRIVSEFMTDDLLGSKRLISMPDRVTNTINVADKDEPVCRPAVINMYDGDLSSVTKWWKQWSSFMFSESLLIKTPEGNVEQKPYEMLKDIKKSKYPAITEDEEKVSLPLQTLCGAIYDSILVHMMNEVSDPNVWQPLKQTMVESLNKKKTPHTLDMLDQVYGHSDIITLQEVASAFIDEARSGNLGKKYWITAPYDMDATRDQNSVIMLNRKTFPDGPDSEITKDVKEAFPAGVDVPVAGGDINAITATTKDGTPYVIGSFHGDTNGLATIPVNTAIMDTINNKPELRDHKLIFGLDANTYEHAKEGKQQDVMEWGASFKSLGETSCWGDLPQPSNYTTFNARTYLQTQLNKACKSTEKRERGDINPKDYILFKKGDFDVIKTWKDNTGKREYIEDMAFPTLDFPSDHGILATVLGMN